MAKVNAARIAALKALYERGDTITEQNFANLIDAIAEAAQEHEHVASGGAGTGTGDAGPVINLQNGLDADKPDSPAPGDIYIATDTTKFYICYTEGVWTDPLA
jgi:hypothetical protein